MGFEQPTFWPAFRKDNHQTKGASAHCVYDFNSLCTKERICISGLTAHNTSVLRTAYADCAFKNLHQIGHIVCLKQMVTAPFYNLPLVQVCP